MSWNYRVMQHSEESDDEYFAIHEAYYNDVGEPDGYTEHPVTVLGASIEELRLILERMLECLAKPIYQPHSSQGT